MIPEHIFIPISDIENISIFSSCFFDEEEIVSLESNDASQYVFTLINTDIKIIYQISFEETNYQNECKITRKSLIIKDEEYCLLEKLLLMVFMYNMNEIENKKINDLIDKSMIENSTVIDNTIINFKVMVQEIEQKYNRVINLIRENLKNYINIY